MEIPGDGLVLRPWRPGDVEALVRHANNRNVWIHLRDGFPHPYTRRDAEDWIRRTGSLPGPPLHFAIVVSGEPVGGAGLERKTDVNRRTAEVGYWLGEAYWGRGLATEAVKRLTDHAFASFHLERLQAGVFSSNPASCRVLEKAGYTREARLRNNVFKDGKLLDELVYARLRGA